MRNGIWRERDKHLVIGSLRLRSYYKQCNRAFPVCGIFSWRAENLLESRSPSLRHFSDSFNRVCETLSFSTLSMNNERNQRKSWRVNFHDHHRCASGSHNETKLQAIWNNSNNSHKLGAGGRHGRRHGNVKGSCACEIIYGGPERHKKNLIWKVI